MDRTPAVQGRLFSDFWSLPNGLRSVLLRSLSVFRPREKVIYMPETADPVTGLINRPHLFKHIKSSKCSGTFIAIEVDRFKLVNEKHGYDVGDLILAKIGNQLQDLCQRAQRFDGVQFIPAKSSGEKFVLFSDQHVPEHYLWNIAKQLEAMFEAPVNTPSGGVSLQVFIGISDGLAAGSAEDSYVHATLAMQDGREKKNTITLFKPELYQSAIRKQDILKQLQSTHSFNGFQLVFQPKIAINHSDNSGVSDFEALLRWNSATLGCVSPAEFIPLAESHTIITKIDEWVLDACVSTLARSKTQGFDTRISCNISAKMLVDPNFPRLVKQLVEDYNVDPSRLQIEVTEHSLIEDVVMAVTNLNALKTIGISIALDDFGNGHSSLGSLRDLPIDTLKIDRSFLQGIHTDSKRRALLEHVIAMGNALELTVVLEGVETAQDVDFVNGSGISYAQGFAYARPDVLEKFF